MGKISKEELARLSGFQAALEIAEKQGVEELRRQVEFRCKTKIPVKLDMEDVKGALMEIQDGIFSTVLLMSAFVLREEFGFGQKRIEQYSKKFKENTEQLNNGDLNWADIKAGMEEEIGYTCNLDEYFLKMNRVE